MDAFEAEIAQKYGTFHKLFPLPLDLKIDFP